MGKLDGKVVIVIGASRGIGAEVARVFAAEGGKVVCAARTLREGDHPLEGSLEYHMINTSRPLEEKLALFWHGVFATGYTKLNQPKAILGQIEMFTRYGLRSFRELLVQVSRDPAMIFWLDNKDNHMDGVNENYGRELLELFSMGVGNYTEDDARQTSRASLDGTIRNATLHAARVSRDSVWPSGLAVSVQGGRQVETPVSWYGVRRLDNCTLSAYSSQKQIHGDVDRPKRPSGSTQVNLDSLVKSLFRSN